MSAKKSIGEAVRSIESEELRDDVESALAAALLRSVARYERDCEDGKVSPAIQMKFISELSDALLLSETMSKDRRAKERAAAAKKKGDE